MRPFISSNHHSTCSEVRVRKLRHPRGAILLLHESNAARVRNEPLIQSRENGLHTYKQPEDVRAERAFLIQSLTPCARGVEVAKTCFTFDDFAYRNRRSALSALYVNCNSIPPCRSKTQAFTGFPLMLDVPQANGCSKVPRFSCSFRSISILG